MSFLRVEIWKSKDPPLIRSEVTVGPSILIHVFTLTCLPPPPPPLQCLGHIDKKRTFFYILTHKSYINWRLRNAQDKSINALAL